MFGIDDNRLSGGERTREEILKERRRGKGGEGGEAEEGQNEQILEKKEGEGEGK